MGSNKSEPSYIDPRCLYSLRGFQAASGITATRMLSARRAGIICPMLEVGRRKFIRVPMRSSTSSGWRLPIKMRRGTRSNSIEVVYADPPYTTEVVPRPRLEYGNYSSNSAIQCNGLQAHESAIECY